MVYILRDFHYNLIWGSFLNEKRKSKEEEKADKGKRASKKKILKLGKVFTKRLKSTERKMLTTYNLNDQPISYNSKVFNATFFFLNVV